ncbi:hypothetical protein GCM10023336_62820 [Streptomyces similanensis]|uniref:Uncharacterized protein n=1 Tax=Streptomyces similanensis TaxID=1274988 RepID=A0ABP9LG07_9ACTN
MRTTATPSARAVSTLERIIADPAGTAGRVWRRLRRQEWQTLSEALDNPDGERLTGCRRSSPAGGRRRTGSRRASGVVTAASCRFDSALRSPRPGGPGVRGACLRPEPRTSNDGADADAHPSSRARIGVSLPCDDRQTRCHRAGTFGGSQPG